MRLGHLQPPGVVTAIPGNEHSHDSSSRVKGEVTAAVVGRTSVKDSYLARLNKKGWGRKGLPFFLVSAASGISLDLVLLPAKTQRPEQLSNFLPVTCPLAKGGSFKPCPGNRRGPGPPTGPHSPLPCSDTGSPSTRPGFESWVLAQGRARSRLSARAGW